MNKLRESTYVDENIVPLIDITIESVRLWFVTVLEEQLPKLLVFFSLVDNLHLLIGFFILLKQLDVLLGLVHVRCQITLRDLGALPNVNWVLTVSLDDKHGARVQHFVALLRVEFINLKST